MIFAQRYNEAGHALSEPTLIDDGDRAYYNARPEWFTWCPTCDTLTAHRSHAAAQDAEDDGHRCVPKPKPKPAPGRAWSAHEDEIVATKQPYAALRALDGRRTLNAIMSRRLLLVDRGVDVCELVPRRTWTADELDLLRNCPDDAQVAKALRRTLDSVRGRRERLNRTRKHAS